MKSSPNRHIAQTPPIRFVVRERLIYDEKDYFIFLLRKRYGYGLQCRILFRSAYDSSRLPGEMVIPTVKFSQTCQIDIANFSLIVLTWSPAQSHPFLPPLLFRVVTMLTPF
jgi:hypothetical protein